MRAKRKSLIYTNEDERRLYLCRNKNEKEKEEL